MASEASPIRLPIRRVRVARSAVRKQPVKESFMSRAMAAIRDRSASRAKTASTITECPCARMRAARSARDRRRLGRWSRRRRRRRAAARSSATPNRRLRTTSERKHHRARLWRDEARQRPRQHGLAGARQAADCDQARLRRRDQPARQREIIERRAPDASAVSGALIEPRQQDVRPDRRAHRQEQRHQRQRVEVILPASSPDSG